MEPVIQVKNLTKDYDQKIKTSGFVSSFKSLFNPKIKKIRAVNSISFEIKKGEKVGFIGPNGAGKTTTLKMLTGLIHPSSGEVSVLGYKPQKKEAELKKQYALVLGQKSQLWWDLPAIASFNLNKHIYEIPDKLYQRNLRELVEILDVEKIINVQVRKLSLGERMKCELLASLLHFPKILFLDEPTIGLDVVIQKKLRQFLNDYNERHQTTILLTSHNMDDVQQLCDRLIIINKGEIIYDGNLDKLVKKHAKQKYIRLFFNQEVESRELRKYGEVLESDLSSALIAVDRSEHTEIAAQVIKKFDIDDLDIQESRLEEIIENIFSESK